VTDTLKIDVHHGPTDSLDGELATFLRAAGPESGVCDEHDPGWLGVLAGSMAHRPYQLVARRTGAEAATPEIVGYLPLALVKSLLFGRFLVSLPYLNRAGVVSRDEQAARALVDRAIELTGELGAKYLELRHGDPVSHDRLPLRRDEKVRMVRALPESDEALWKDISAKVRNQIRKGEKQDFAIAFGGEELLPGFYDVFAENMRDLGTPVYGRSLFRSILRAFPDRAELVVVRHEGEPAAAALLVHGDAATQVPSASALRRFNPTNVNMWMYHRLLVRAIERGAAAFDFGRSSEGSGTYRFKKQWGAEPSPTVWQYHLREGDMDAMRPDSGRNQRRIEQWKKLPVWLTRLVGPRIVRGIP